MDTGYAIIKERYKDKILSIYNSEITCPICSKQGVMDKVECRGAYSHNIYSCPECGTVWGGNYYDDNGDIKRGSAPVGDRFREEPDKANKIETALSFIISAVYICAVFDMGTVGGIISTIIFDILPIIALGVVYHIRSGMNEKKGKDRLAAAVRFLRTLSLFTGIQLTAILCWLFLIGIIFFIIS